MKENFKVAVFALALAPLMAAAQDFDAGQSAYEAGDYQTAVKEWRPLAKIGDASAQNALGLIYADRVYSYGVPQDYAEARKWYRLAADQGYARAFRF